MLRENHPIYRFGVLELERRTGELRRGGVKLKLQDQPCQIARASGFFFML
jgi:hypothetical protein